MQSLPAGSIPVAFCLIRVHGVPMSNKLLARAWAARPKHCCGWAACTLVLFYTPAEAVLLTCRHGLPKGALPSAE